MIIFSKVEFKLGKKVLLTVENSDLYAAIAKAKEGGIDTMGNSQIIISCFY